MKINEYDVIIIGGGVVGCAVAREISKYSLKTCLLEKADDVCSGTSKANSAIVHAGFDAKPYTRKAEMNVLGNSMIHELANKLDFSFIENGSMVLCFEEGDKEKLFELYERGKINGVKGLKILSKQEALLKEPNLSDDDVVAALYAPTGGIVCPFGMTIAFAENANENGVEFVFNSCVRSISKSDDTFSITTDNEVYKAKYIVNAAGVHSDEIHNMICTDKISIQPRSGEYCLLDKTEGKFVHSTIFQLPGKMGKGILVSPTVHGNLLIGPTAVDVDDKDDTSTTADGISTVLTMALKSVKTIPKDKVITSFTGIRAHEVNGDFILGENSEVSGFFDAAGVESPGLTSAPAIGLFLANQIAAVSKAKLKSDYKDTRKGFTKVAELSFEDRKKLIAEHPEYGNVICRCEQITEGEILEAIRRPLGAKSLDAIKRRVRQGMGRCQAGFCSPKTISIIAMELGIKETEVCKNIKGSEQLCACENSEG